MTQLVQNFITVTATFFSASIIWIENEKSTPDKLYITSISFEDEFDHNEFFDLFKRFKVNLTKKHNGHQDREIDEEITIDDRETAE